MESYIIFLITLYNHFINNMGMLISYRCITFKTNNINSYIVSLIDNIIWHSRSSHAAEVHRRVCLHHHISSWPNSMAFMDILRISQCQFLLRGNPVLRHCTNIPYNWFTVCIYQKRIYIKTWIISTSRWKTGQISSSIILSNFVICLVLWCCE